MSLTVYYLDDEPALGSIFQDIFSTDEILIQTFVNASDAIEACHSNPPDIIFIDMSLAETTGDKVAEQLEESLFKVLVTGDLSHQSHHLFQACFGKPYDMQSIQQLLDEKLAGN